MLSVIYVVCLLFIPSVHNAQAKFLKCCPFNQQLDQSFQRCVNRTTLGYEEYVVDDGSADQGVRYPWWLPKNVTVLSSATRQPVPGFFVGEPFLEKVQDRGWTFCDSSSAMLLINPGDFAYLDDGSLLVESGVGPLPPMLSCADHVAIPGEDLAVVMSCPCTYLPCLRKCCPEGYSLAVIEGKSLCIEENSDDDPWLVSFAGGTTASDFALVYGNNFCGQGSRMYALEPGASRTAVVQADGSLAVDGHATIPRQQFCVDRDHVLSCSLENASNTMYGVMTILGAVFLAATLLVQWLLPQRGGHARHLMAHTSSLLITYVALSVGLLSSYPPPVACYIVAFTIQFSFLAAIFWLNVMCIDIAWSFSGFHISRGSFMKCQKKRFRLYSLYAWGSCIIISVITIIMQFSPAIPDSAITPEFGRRNCWFGSKMATLVYFYGPVSCLLLGNLVLFIYTVVRIIKMRRSTEVLRQSESAYHRGKLKEEDKMKKRFMLYLKLFGLMGATWTMEVISWAVNGHDYYWYITDAVNILRAVFIFIIFCCRREVLTRVQSCMNRIMPWCVPKPPGSPERDGSSSGHTDSSRFAGKISRKASAGSHNQDTAV